jgi:hypothetical protein
MASVSKTLPTPGSPVEIGSQQAKTSSSSRSGLIWQIAITFLFLEAALWTPPGLANLVFICATLISIFVGMRLSGFSAEHMGLSTPPARSAGRIVAIGSVLALSLQISAYATGFDSPPFHPMTGNLIVLYTIWGISAGIPVAVVLFLAVGNSIWKPGGSARSRAAVQLRSSSQPVPHDRDASCWHSLLRTVSSFPYACPYRPDTRRLGIGSRRQRLRFSASPHAGGHGLSAVALIF